MVREANDRRTSCPCPDEFRGPRSDYVRQQYPTKLLEVLRSNIGFSFSPLDATKDYFRCPEPFVPGKRH
ncbi:hypothetical protein TNCV_1953121 [Trichonephila clavipes]|nr:hypothetical protein TNCV_1953121 [Trichonephila clavipes]